MPAAPSRPRAAPPPSDWAARVWVWLRAPRTLGASVPEVPRVQPSAPPPARSGQSPPAPWVAAAPAAALEPGALRAGLLRGLLAEQAGLAPGPDRAFVERLLHLVGDERLELPVFPAVAQEINGLLAQGQPSASAVARLIEHEPDLLRRVWQAGGRGPFARRPASLDHAIARMGLDGLWRVVMEASVHAPVLHVGRMQAAALRSRARSVVAAEVASWLLDEPRGDAWMAGMLHGVGRLVIYTHAAGVRGDRPSFGLVDRLAERLHPSVGVLVAQAWGLSPAVALGVGAYPAPDWQVGAPQALARAVRAGVVAGWTLELGRQGLDCGGEEELRALSAGLWSPAEALARARRVDPEQRATA